MKKALLWMLVFFLSLGVYSAQAQSGLPQAAGWLNPEIFERYPSYFVEETTGKWRVRTLEADALLDRFWSDGADYDGELCIFFPEIEGYFQSGVWMPVLRMYFMQGSREVQAHAVALRVDETVYTLPAHTAIVENGRHAAEVVSVPLGEYAAQVLSIPRKIKSQEVVRRGFMSNFLFQNISNIFGAPTIVQKIVEKLAPAQEDSGKRQPMEKIKNISVGQDGEVDIPKEIVIGKTRDLFGEKIYETITNLVEDTVAAVGTSDDIDTIGAQIKTLTDAVTQNITQTVLAPAADDYGIAKGAQNRMVRQLRNEIETKVEKSRSDFEQQARVAKAEMERKRKEVVSEQEMQQIDADYAADMEGALKLFADSVRETVQYAIQNKPKEIVEQLEKNKAEREKNSVEDKVRNHLRGFSRTIPSFIMAYGDENLTLSNFDEYTEEEVFLEVTGITEEDFRFLRDGGDYTNPETGETEHFAGRLFDEVVFNDSVAEFLKKKNELADYFDESHDEDIFDYIPPQKTNQIFTPRRVVKMMVDLLEENNPGCFDNPNHTFADLYMKSGLYITEIVKRLYRSEAIKSTFPDDKERIRHILRKQVYGMAPTRIIYLIATNYILGFDPELKDETRNFVQADAAEAAKSGALQQLVDEKFGE